VLRRCLQRVVAALASAAGRLPRGVVLCLGRCLGFAAFTLLRVRRRVTLENLDRALQLTGPERLRLAGRVYRHLCVGALEFLQIPRLTRQRAAELLGDGVSRLEQLRADKGLLVLTAHLGQWDLLACAAAMCGVKLHVVTRSIKAGWLNDHWMAVRRRCGVDLLAAQGSGWAIRAALRQREVVALVLDQHEPGGVAVPFFGRPAWTATALARLALATGAPVVAAFLLRDGKDGFRLILSEPLRVQRTGNHRDDISVNTAGFTAVLEEQIRQAPEQWLWLHRRWKA